MIKNRVIHAVCWGLLVAAAQMIVVDGPVFAQGMGGGGMGGGGMSRPKRKLKKNAAPVLSPALNMLPETSTTFDGQFLMRTLPQQQAIDTFGRQQQSLDKLQGEIRDTDNQVKTGIKGTGHNVRFMNYGSYYSFGGGRGGGR